MTFKTLALPALLALTLPAFAQTAAIDATQFAAQAASSNMFEIESSRVALQKVPQGPVADFAQHMIDDHTAAGDKMIAAAMKDGVTPPDTMTEAHQATLDQLSALDAQAFESAYITAQAAAHQEAVALFTAYSTDGQDGALRSFAAETLPTLQEHEREISEIAAR